MRKFFSFLVVFVFVSISIEALGGKRVATTYCGMGECIEQYIVSQRKTKSGLVIVQIKDVPYCAVDNCDPNFIKEFSNKGLIKIKIQCATPGGYVEYDNGERIYEPEQDPIHPAIPVRQLWDAVCLGCYPVDTRVAECHKGLYSTSNFAGKLTIGKKYSYIFYYGEESGDSIVHYFDTKSDVGRKIISVCKNFKNDCCGVATIDIDNKVPKGIPESTSGTSRIVAARKIKRCK